MTSSTRFVFVFKSSVSQSKLICAKVTNHMAVDLIRFCCCENCTNHMNYKHYLFKLCIHFLYLKLIARLYLTILLLSSTQADVQKIVYKGGQHLTLLCTLPQRIPTDERGDDKERKGQIRRERKRKKQNKMKNCIDYRRDSLVQRSVLDPLF